MAQPELREWRCPQCRRLLAQGPSDVVVTITCMQCFPALSAPFPAARLAAGELEAIKQRHRAMDHPQAGRVHIAPPARAP